MTTKTRNKKAGWLMMDAYLDGRNALDVTDDIVRYIRSIALQQADNMTIPAIERLVDWFNEQGDVFTQSRLSDFISLLMRMYFALPDEKVVREGNAPPANEHEHTVLRGTKDYLIGRIRGVVRYYRDPLCVRTWELERTYIRFLADAAFPAEQRIHDPSVHTPYDRSRLAKRFVSRGEESHIVEEYAKSMARFGENFDLRRIECQLSVVGLPLMFLSILGKARVEADPLQVELDASRKRAQFGGDIDPRYALLEYEQHMRGLGTTDGWIEGIRCIPIHEICFTQDPDGHHWTKITLQSTAERRMCEALMDALPKRIATYKAAHPNLNATLSYQLFVGSNDCEEKGA